MNAFKIFILMAGLMLVLLLAGSLMRFSPQGMFMLLLFGGFFNFIMYWFSDRIVLMGMSAQEVTSQQAPDLVRMVESLCQQAELPMPKLYVVTDPSPNAFATGRSPEHAVVAVTTGLLETLKDNEIRAVVAHELGHVKNRDMLVATIAAGVASAITALHYFAYFAGGDRENRNPLGLLVVFLVAPLAALIIQMMISRTREYEADHASALFTHRPLDLASALRKISVAAQGVPAESVKESTVHLMINNPLRGGLLRTLFSTHPAIEDRVARLEELARTGL
jgi:heat shock protein HtpX